MLTALLGPVTAAAITGWLWTGLYIGGGLFALDQSLFYAQPGKSYLVQYPLGGQDVILDPGYNQLWFGEAIGFDKIITVAFISDEELERREAAGASFAGTAPPMTIRFNDSVTASVEMTARFQLPEDPEQFREMAIANRNQQTLVYSTLIPIMQEAMKNSGQMFSAQEYIMGRGGEFKDAINDQIRNGIFLLDVKEVRVAADPNASGGPTHGSALDLSPGQTVRLRVSIRTEDGMPVRKDHGDHLLKKFGIRLIQSNVHRVDPDPVFKEALREQREAAARVAIERQLTRREEERRKRVVAQGEAEKAERRIELEKQQITTVLAAETRALEAEQIQRQRVVEAETLRRQAEVEKARKEIELQTAQLEAQRVTTLANAEAERRRKLMEADNALQQRLATFEAVAKAYADAIRGQRLVPEIVIGGGGGESTANATDLINLLIARLAGDLGATLTEPQPTRVSRR